MLKISFFFSLLSLLVNTNLLAQWEIKNLDTTAYSDISDIKFIDNLNGIAATLQGTFLKTTDGGNTWKKSATTKFGQIHKMEYLNGNQILAVSDTNVLISEDQGNLWSSISSFPGKQLLSLHFFNRQEGIVAGFDGIYHTSNGGADWDTSWNVKSNSYQFGQINSINFPTAVEGFAICSAYSKENKLFEYFLLASINGGKDWNRISTFPEFPNSLYFHNKDTGFVGSNAGNIFKTSDRGKTWSKENVTNKKIMALQFINDSTGFAVSETAGFLPEGNYSTFSISKTIDDGNSWNTYDTIGAGLNTVFFINNETGFVGGQQELIMKTSKSIFQLPSDYPFYLFNVTGVSASINPDAAVVISNPFTDEIYFNLGRSSILELILTNAQGVVVL